jgi:hypothetical protein
VVAARVSARTLLNDSSPLAIASEICGSDSSARATRTFSVAVWRVMPTRQASQSAQHAKPSSAQSPCRSLSASARRNSREAAVISA